MKKFKNAVSAGFTLVELLIVIGLLGAIALIVISAINPIEQSNRARDTRFKADGGQLISAIDRYYTGSNDFPWMVGSALTVDDSFGYITASDPTVGICDATNCGDGVLLTSQELKSEFKNRDFVKATKAEEMIYIGKEGDANASVYACFVPLSKSFRSKAIADSKVWTISSADGTKTATTSCDVTWANTCYVCIPE